MTAERRAPGWLTRRPYAHRGLHGVGVPENSLAAAERAVAAGFGIECDIQLSAAGTPFVFHDWKLDRLTGADGPFAGPEDNELGLLSLLGTGQNPATLELFLKVVAGRVPVLIEIKSQPGYDVVRSCEAVLRVVQAYHGDYAIMSFDPRVPQWLAERSPGTCRGLVGTDSLPNGFEHVWRSPTDLDRARPDFLAIDRRDLHRIEADSWRGPGRPLLSWTIRTRSERDAALPLADALIAEGDALA